MSEPISMRRFWLLALAGALATWQPLFGQATYDASKPPTADAAKTAVLGAPIDAPDCTGCAGFDWAQSKYRYQKFFWVVGYPFIAPTGPGYYSAWDQHTDNFREAPPKSGYPRFFALAQGFNEADFTYLDNPNHERLWWENWHRVPFGDNWMLSTGGEYRNRYDYEQNSRLTGKTNSFDLNRLRIFGEAWYQDKFRFFIEFLDARSTHQTLNPLLSDTDHADILNASVDIKTLMIGNDAVYTRLGRQQILLGSQRIVSPSDWGFSLRTWDGARAFRRSEKFDIDAFWLRPVVPSTNRFDSSDNNQNFAGIYTTYRPQKNQVFETYWLYLSNHDSVAYAKASPVGPLNASAVPYDIHTLGFRYAGKGNNGFLWEFENLAQLGDHNGQNVFAGNLTNGIGWNFSHWMWSPTVWGYFDYASGSSSTKGGTTHTFNQLYPLGHYYLGQQDYIGRANIEDLNFHLYLYPTKWITLNAQYHIFELANAKDALYNTGASVSRLDATGKAGRDVGSEFDLSANFHLTATTDLLAVYTHFFSGSFLNATGPSADLNTVYLVLNIRW